MLLTDYEASLISESFAKLAPTAKQATRTFYNQLFDLAPDTKQLFENTDLREQELKFMETLGSIIGSLYKPESYLKSMRELGERHIDYGVTAKQYDVVGDALIATLQQELKDAFTDDMKSAWTKLYTILADAAKGAYTGAS